MTINNNISEVLITIGKNVKKHRILKNMTQQDLAYKCGNMDKGTVSNIERFACEGLNISTLTKLSHALEINISAFFDK